jgi:hypothetical protein
MNFEALNNLTTKELMLIAQKSGDLVETRLAGGIKDFLTYLSGVAAAKDRWLVRRTQEDGPIVVEISANFDNAARMLKEFFPKLLKSGLTPILHMEELDAETTKDLLMTVYVETWPQSWAFLQTLETPTTTIEAALRVYGEKNDG